jgi:hypothetical protein
MVIVLFGLGSLVFPGGLFCKIARAARVSPDRGPRARVRAARWAAQLGRTGEISFHGLVI